MANGSQKAVWILSLALAVVLLAFFMVRDCFGPDDIDAPARVLTYVCEDAACRCRVTVPLTEAEAANPALWKDAVPCPNCRAQARRAEACTACGAIVPTPADGRLLGAKCPECGGYLFGPPGGVMPKPPMRAKTSENGDDRESRRAAARRNDRPR